MRTIVYAVRSSGPRGAEYTPGFIQLHVDALGTDFDFLVEAEVVSLGGALEIAGRGWRIDVDIVKERGIGFVVVEVVHGCGLRVAGGRSV